MFPQSWWYEGEFWADIGNIVEDEEGVGCSMDKEDPPYVWLGLMPPFAIICCVNPGWIWL